jgi:hypothetical protein
LGCHRQGDRMDIGGNALKTHHDRSRATERQARISLKSRQA